MPGLFSVLKGNSRDPAAVSHWVMENVPCFKGPVPQDWTQAVYYEASVRRIPPWVLTFGLSPTRKYGYQLSDSTGGISRLTVNDLNHPNTGPQLSPADPARRRETSIATMKYLNYQFGIASANGDHPEMLRLAKQFVKLLDKAGPRELPYEEIVHGAPLIRRAIVYVPPGAERRRAWGPVRGRDVPSS
jgi:hypothetical protein